MPLVRGRAVHIVEIAVRRQPLLARRAPLGGGWSPGETQLYRPRRRRGDRQQEVAAVILRRRDDQRRRPAEMGERDLTHGVALPERRGRQADRAQQLAF